MTVKPPGSSTMSGKMRVLVAEDDPINRMWLETVLASWNYDVVAVSNGDEVIHLMNGSETPMLILLDWLMPGMDGIDVCRRLKADAHNRFCHIVMLTSRSSTADVVEALNAGADDFISKPFEPEELQVRLRVGERMIQLHQELLFKASYDELTGLFSRRMLMDMAQREIDLAVRNRLPLSLLLLDLDHFKNINDIYGHQAGDAVLQIAALRLGEQLRETDIIGRYGGEEIMVVLPGSDMASAKAIAERLRVAFADPVVYEHLTIPVTASIGLTAMTGSSNDLQALIQSADAALYRAKSKGRDRVEVYE